MMMAESSSNPLSDQSCSMPETEGTKNSPPDSLKCKNQVQFLCPRPSSTPIGLRRQAYGAWSHRLHAAPLRSPIDTVRQHMELWMADRILTNDVHDEDDLDCTPDRDVFAGAACPHG